MTTVRLLLIGDRDETVTAHRAIPLSIGLCADSLGINVDSAWPGTVTIAAQPALLNEFDAFWCVPASPYASAVGALRAIRHAREHGRPFLGTCGGFQHALLEYVASVLGAEAAHAEESPEASDPVIEPLACSMVEVPGDIIVRPGTRAASLLPSRLREEYHCSYGLSPAWRSRLEGGALEVSGEDASGEPRIIELAGHPFYMATLFQPERTGLRGEIHPLVRAFLEAAATAACASPRADALSHTTP